MNVPSILVLAVSAIALLLNLYFWSSTRKQIKGADLDDDTLLLKKDRDFFLRSMGAVVVVFIVGQFLGPNSWFTVAVVVMVVMIIEFCAALSFFFLGHETITQSLHDSNS